MKILEMRPVQGTFRDARVRTSWRRAIPTARPCITAWRKLGRGRMPHIGSEVVDEPGLRLMHDWIRQLPIRKDERAAGGTAA